MVATDNPQIAYAVHPYPKGYDPVKDDKDPRTRPQYYRDRFGYLQERGFPVLITEWLAWSDPAAQPGLHMLSDYDIALALATFAYNNRIGLVVSAFDVTGGIFSNTVTYPNRTNGERPDVNTYVATATGRRKPTSFLGYKPRQPGCNAGVLMKNFFAMNYANKHTFTRSDAETDVSVPKGTAPDNTCIKIF